MSYSWIGPPTVFNGTNEITGGDSGEYNSMYPLVYTRHPHLARRRVENNNQNPEDAY
jgi:hypothetical protein